MADKHPSQVFDYVIIGSGFGGSVSAMRLTEKGYSVLVMERGKRFEDHDFAKTSWNVFRYLVGAGAALLRCSANQPVQGCPRAAWLRGRRRQPGLCQRADAAQR